MHRHSQKRILFIFVLGLLLTLSACVEQTSPMATSIPSATDIPEIYATPTILPTATPESEPGSLREKPLPFGSPAIQNGISVTVEEVVRDAEAWQKIQEANQYNKPLPAEQEYLLLRMRVKNIGTGDEAVDISSGDFFITGDKLRKYFSASAVAPKPALQGGIFPDGELSGWVVYPVAAGEHNLMLVLPAPYGDDAPTLYLALEEGAAIATDARLGTLLPTDNGLSRAEPAAIGEVIRTETWEITLKSVLRAEKAWEKISAANSYNDPPAEGMIYMLANVSARYIGRGDDSAWLGSGDFKSTGSKNVVYDTPSVVEPTPRLNAILYPGGSVEGWLAVQFAADEEKRLLIFDASFGNDRRFIKLSE